MWWDLFDIFTFFDLSSATHWRIAGSIIVMIATSVAVYVLCSREGWTSGHSIAAASMAAVAAGLLVNLLPAGINYLLARVSDNYQK